MTVRDRVKARALPLRRSRLGRWLADAVLIAHSHRVGRSPRLAGLLHRLSVYDPAGPEERARTVTALVELVFDLVEGLGVERFVEAGAKEGAASRRATTIPSVDEVVAFEANPFTYRRFAADHEGSPVSYEHVALSDNPGTVTMQIRLRPDGKPSADGQSSLLVRPGHGAGYVPLVVEATTLDERFGPPTGRRTAVWIDVEGATKQVLGGGRGLLGETDLLVVEVEERVAWDGQEWLRGDVAHELRAHGLVPVARDRQSRYQFNLLFVRATRLADPAVARALAVWRRAVRVGTGAPIVR